MENKPIAFLQVPEAEKRVKVFCLLKPASH